MLLLTTRCKKGQFGLVDIFSYLLYFLVVLVFIVILSLPGCLTGINEKAEGNIGADISLAHSVRADAQLTSYLRTMMPEKAELFARLDWLEKNKGAKYVKELVKELKIDFGKTKDFLNMHPEVYAEKDYSGFLSSLHAFYVSGVKKDNEDAERAFRAVTAATFLRAVKDYPKKGEYMYYLLPVGVDFSPADLKPSSKASVCADYDLCAQYLPYDVIPRSEDPLIYIPPQRFFSQTVQAVPLADSALAKIEFRYLPERSAWLPKP